MEFSVSLCHKDKQDKQDKEGTENNNKHLNQVQ